MDFIQYCARNKDFSWMNQNAARYCAPIKIIKRFWGDRDETAMRMDAR